MIIRIKNADNIDHTWAGTIITTGEYYMIPANELVTWQTNDVLLTAIVNGLAIVNNGTSDLTAVSSQIDYLKGNTPKDVSITSIMVGRIPFAAKIMPDGQKIYTRVHGTSAVVSGTPYNIDFVVPYAACKFTGIEIINGDLGDKANFKILDTALGTLTGTPNFLLNQFGFNVNVSGAYYKRESTYDADLVQDLVLRLEYNSINSDLLPKTIYINFIFHEIKP